MVSPWDSDHFKVGNVKRIAEALAEAIKAIERRVVPQLKPRLYGAINAQGVRRAHGGTDEAWARGLPLASRRRALELGRFVKVSELSISRVKKVVDPATNEVLREVDERLSDHQGRGDGKRPKL
jgi:hypothetical protein